MTQDDGFKPSRRQVAAGVMVTAAALAAPVAQAAQGSGQGSAQGSGQGSVPNPVTEYPKPPFPRQQQEAPGLSLKMHPQPDYGEKTYRGSGKLAGRKALITGGDSGIGRAAAIAFAREGADVAFNYLPVEEPDAREVVESIRRSGRKAFPLPGDLRDEKFCQQLMADAVRNLGGLDILVSNAGKQHSVEHILDLTTEQFDATFKTNVYAMFWLTKAAIPHFKPGAAIINTASVEAYDPGANLLDYAQTKAAIVAFTKALAKQLAPQGIRVNAVAPGPIWTPLQVSGGQPVAKTMKFGETTPYGRPGQPAELAPVYVLLASSAASYITGHVYGVAGGSGYP
jgi:NAD(P)-dependent dehydrogenase (short-subunit alcohol dehydrogenase family)